MSKFGPPNATDVICTAGNKISISTLPVLHQKKQKFVIFLAIKVKDKTSYVPLTLTTFSPPNVATYKSPLASIVIPSGTLDGRPSPVRKLMKTRSFAMLLIRKYYSQN